MLNETFSPVLLSWIEEPFTPLELRHHFQKLVRLTSDGLHNDLRYVVIILDDVAKFSAAGRKRLAEAWKQHLTPELNDVILGSYLTVPSALARGSMIAFSWLAPDVLKRVHPVATRQDALDSALRKLEEHGTPFVGSLPALKAAIAVEALRRQHG